MVLIERSIDVACNLRMKLGCQPNSVLRQSFDIPNPHRQFLSSLTSQTKLYSEFQFSSGWNLPSEDSHTYRRTVTALVIEIKDFRNRNRVIDRSVSWCFISSHISTLLYSLFFQVVYLCFTSPISKINMFTCRCEHLYSRYVKLGQMSVNPLQFGLAGN